MALPLKVVCPDCGESDLSRLKPERRRTSERGIQKVEFLRVTCKSCGAEWERHPGDCPSCGVPHTLAEIRRPLFQKARGEQQSIIGYRIAEECSSCGWTSEKI